MGVAEIVDREAILRGEVGSTAHGTGLDGHEDRDEMAVFVEPKEAVMGLAPIDHYVHRTAGEGRRSGPGDLDLTAYSLRKFVRLCVDGNPSILLLLHLPRYMVRTAVGDALVARRDLFVSRRAGERFLGYMAGQRDRLTGGRGLAVQRPELVERFGFDTKYAMHALRIGLQGREFVETGRISVPAVEPARRLLIDVRNGRLSLADTLAAIDDAAAALRVATEACELRVDVAAVDGLLVALHEAHWSAGPGS